VIAVYHSFLDRYAAFDKTMEVRFSLGQALYFSDRFMEAVDQFELVKKGPQDDKFWADACRSVVQSYEAEAARLVNLGTIVPLRQKYVRASLLTLNSPIPPVYAALQKSLDALPAQTTTADQRSGIHWSAVQISMTYQHLDDAVA
jgi:hypothetical protein